jgi:hypothetical protein
MMDDVGPFSSQDAPQPACVQQGLPARFQAKVSAPPLQFLAELTWRSINKEAFRRDAVIGQAFDEFHCDPSSAAGRRIVSLTDVESSNHALSATPLRSITLASVLARTNQSWDSASIRWACISSDEGGFLNACRRNSVTS